MKKLSNLDAREISLVPRGANRRKFLVLKSGAAMREEDIKEMLKPVDAKVEEVIRKYSTVRKDDLTAEGRKHIAEHNFALPAERKYPIHDLAHARNALARVAQHGTPEEKKKVQAAVYRKYPALKERADKMDVEKDLNDVGPVDERAQSALKAVVRILTPFKDSLSPVLLHEVLSAAGLQMQHATEQYQGEDMDKKMGSATQSPEPISEEHHMEALGKAFGAYKEHMHKLGYRKYPTQQPTQKDMEGNYGDKGKVVRDEPGQGEIQSGNMHNPEPEDMVSKKKEADDMDGDDVCKSSVMKSLLANVPKETRAAVEEVFKSNQNLARELALVKKTAYRKELIQKYSHLKGLGVKVEDLVETMQVLSEKAPDQFEKVEKMILAADEQIAKGSLFSEVGSDREGVAGDWYAKIESAAMAQVQKSGEKLSKEAAVERFLDTPEGKQMYNQYLSGHPSQRRG